MINHIYVMSIIVLSTIVDNMTTSQAVGCLNRAFSYMYEILTVR